MFETLSHELGWWIVAIEIPVIASLFWLIWNAHDQLTKFRIEVAQNYASQRDLRELEARITSHLLRIEAKLETTALKTEAMSAHKK